MERGPEECGRMRRSERRQIRGRRVNSVTISRNRVTPKASDTCPIGQAGAAKTSDILLESPMLRLRRRPRYDWVWLTVTGAVAAVLVYVLSPILAPFLAAAILAYILDPIVDKFEQ